MKVLVTGATGFLGRHLVQSLVQRGADKIRVLAREPIPKWLSELPVDLVPGSILDKDALKKAVKGIEGIYHLAGRVSRNQDDQRSLYEVHVDGTRLLCAAARDARVKRMVLASTSGTIAVSASPDEKPDESKSAPTDIIGRWAYYSSKFYQENVARNACKDGGPELVIVHPSLLLGPGDDRLSSTIDVLRFLKKQIPTVPSGGMNFVDVRDVAAALITAMQQGKNGESYLLGGPNWTMSEFFGRLERLTKVPAPKIKVNNRLAVVGAHLLDAWYQVFDKEAPVDPVSVEMATYYWYLNDSKARKELSFVTRDPTQTLYDTVDYLRMNVLNSSSVFQETPRS